MYVAFGRAVNAFVPEPVRALALLSAMAQALLVLPLFLLFRALGAPGGRAAAATALVLANPIVWFNGARPMSDSLGLLLVLVAQVLLLRGAESPRSLLAGSALAALAIGVRVQAALLTVPLMLYAMARARRGRALAVLALLVGLALWVGPLLIASGGLSGYRGAFDGSLHPLPVEPLATTFTFNRALKTALRVALAPWISVGLGATVSVLATFGLIVLAGRRSPALRLALLAFAPYLVAHFLLQQTRTLLCQHAVPAAGRVAGGRGPGLISERARAPVLTSAVVAGLAGWSAVRTLPALSEYHREPSPPTPRCVPWRPKPRTPLGALVSGHYVFRRYLAEVPPGLRVLPSSPGQEVAALEEHWRSGGQEPVLFLADGDRTDLDSVAPASRRLLFRWRWRAARRFFRGERPNAVELVRIDRPRWFAGDGWRLSLEAGALPALRDLAARRAFLDARDGPSFLLVAGQPTAPDAAEFELELALQGQTLERQLRDAPLLQGFTLPAWSAPSASAGAFAELVATTRQRGSAAGAPFALNGLAYGAGTRPASCTATAGSIPRPMSGRGSSAGRRGARARAPHVPPGGGRLVVAGLALRVRGQGPACRRERGRGPARDGGAAGPSLPPGGGRARRAAVPRGIAHPDRSFVPDHVQKNRDRRSWPRVYDFRLEPRTAEARTAALRTAATPPR